MPDQRSRVQFLCSVCKKHKAGKHKHGVMCVDCHNKQQRHPSCAAAAAPAPPAPPLFPLPRQKHLSTVERAAISVLHLQGLTRQAIGQQTATSQPTVRHWIQQYEQTGDVKDEPRCGRPRCTDEAMDTAIVGAAYAENNFCTPRGLKRKYQFEPSARTIDRRLREVNLFGRVARHQRKFSDADRQKRLSFAEGYASWTAEQWERVLFSDEKKFKGEGFMGQVWVRRPPGEALNPAYCVDKLPHPVKLNVWGCFCAAGVGYLYVFNENMDAALLKRIFASGHLLESAEDRGLMEGGEWWLLQDNDPKHKSKEVQTWLHNHGVSLLDFPPYSPDLNPMENLWSNLARRVEARPASTIEELQDVIAEEWERTSPALLRKLARGMPKRCKAVIDAKGEHTKY